MPLFIIAKRGEFGNRYFVFGKLGGNFFKRGSYLVFGIKIYCVTAVMLIALDLGLLPSAVKGDDGLEAMYGLLTTFMNRNGHAIQINVLNADTLRDAQAHPEKYQDLQIRVCGWNALWNNISKVEQDGFIKQAEGLI